MVPSRYHAVEREGMAEQREAMWAVTRKGQDCGLSKTVIVLTLEILGEGRLVVDYRLHGETLGARRSVLPQKSDASHDDERLGGS